MSDNVTPINQPKIPKFPDRAEPTVQLCLNDAELKALEALLETVPIVQNAILMPVLIDIKDGDYLTLDE